MIPLSGLLSITILFILLELLIGFSGFYLLFIGFGFFGVAIISTILEIFGVAISWDIQVALAVIIALILIFTKAGKILKQSLVKTKKDQLKDENVFDGITKGTISNGIIVAHGTFWKHKDAINLPDKTEVEIEIKNSQIVSVRKI